MSLNDVQAILTFIGGLGMFLYGMTVMAKGLQKSAGNKMKRLLEVLTTNMFMGVLVGALVTGIIQSSTATTVMVVGFVNAGLMNLSQAVGVIMGANIGTTATSWIISMNEWGAIFKPEFIAPLVIGVGAFVILFTKSEKKREISTTFVGFGILFIGLTFMSDSIEPYKDAPIFADIFVALSRNPLLALLAGTIVTAIIQSSTASVAILQTLAFNGIVDWQAAIFITLGQNIGTCFTTMLSGIGTNKTARRAAVIHLLFNVIGVVVVGIVMFIIFLFDKEWATSTISSTEIALFHTIFNIANVIIVVPFVKGMIKMSEFFIRGSDVQDDADEVKLVRRHLDPRIMESPSFALEYVTKEVIHMGEVTRDNVKNAISGLITKDLQKSAKVIETEKKINEMETVITEYLIKVGNLSLTEKQHKKINHLFYTISDIERVGDHSENIAEFSEYMINNNLNFSEAAQKEIGEISIFVQESFENSIEARKTEDIDRIRKVVKLEDEVDSLEEDLRERHIQRLSNNQCDPMSGVVFLDLISNLERISDHALNIANYVRDEID